MCYKRKLMKNVQIQQQDELLNLKDTKIDFNNNSMQVNKTLETEMS